MQVSEYRVTMKHDEGTALITVTASSASAAVDYVIQAEGAPRRAARLVETRPLQFERIDDAWTPVPGDQWGRVNDQPANVDVHTNPFAPDPANPFITWSARELENARSSWATLHAEQFDRPDDVRKASHVGEELSRREDVDRAVELWERLCAVDFVRGETQGYYAHSTAHLSPETTGHSGHASGRVHRMPNREELEALVLSDGEETAYPVHEFQDGGVSYRQDQNPWSGDDRLYPITLTLISCGDYHGSDLDAANNRALDGTPGVMVREPKTGGMGSVFNVSTTVVGEMSSLENATDPGDTDREPAQRRADALERLESLVKQMEGLTNYPLLNDETHSEYLAELAEEAWSDHLERDALDMLRDLLSWQDLEPGEELQALIKRTYFGYGENEWNAKTATSAVNGRHEDAVKHVASVLFGWNVP